MSRQKYTILSNAEKIEILRYCEVNDSVSDSRVSKMFSQRFNKTISRKTINNLKKNKKTILEEGDSSLIKMCKKPILKFDSIDRSLKIWLDDLENKGGIITDNLLMEKAIQIAKFNGECDFKASKGWLAKFKSRHQLKLRRLHGESYSTSSISYETFFNSLSIKIKEYGVENVFNADETGIFYKLIPSKSICKEVRSGYKLLKDRVSVLFCVNMTGSIKRKPLVIGKFSNPRCFKGFDPNSIVQYKSSTRAWMTSKIFNNWLLSWDMELSKKGNKILLVIDNCPAHRIEIELKSIEILFLPVNSTSKIQPLDQGIINAFKAKLASKKLSDIIEKIESGENLFELYKKITVKNAICYIYLAWQEISSSTIKNCFKHAGWSIQNKNSEMSSNLNNEEDSTIDVYNNFIHKANINDPMEESEFLSISYNENETILEESLANKIDEMETKNDNSENKSNSKVIDYDDDEEEEDEEEKEEERVVISKKDCYKSLEILKKYFNQPTRFNLNAINGINEISKALKKDICNGNLDDWIIKKEK